MPVPPGRLDHQPRVLPPPAANRHADSAAGNASNAGAGDMWRAQCRRAPAAGVPRRRLAPSSIHRRIGVDQHDPAGPALRGTRHLHTAAAARSLMPASQPHATMGQHHTNVAARIRAEPGLQHSGAVWVGRIPSPHREDALATGRPEFWPPRHWRHHHCRRKSPPQDTGAGG